MAGSGGAAELAGSEVCSPPGVVYYLQYINGIPQALRHHFMNIDELAATLRKSDKCTHFNMA